jgi:PhnB protein
MLLRPYLHFDGRCEEAFEFYRNALGAEATMILRFKDAPTPPEQNGPAPGSENKIMHMQFRIGEQVVLASDGHCQGNPHFQGFSLTLSVASEAEADKIFAALGDGGKVQMPLTKTFFSPRFGMLADRFGVAWMILVER